MGNQGPHRLFLFLESCLPQVLVCSLPWARLAVSQSHVPSFLIVPSLRRQLSFRLTHPEVLLSGLVSSLPAGT